MLTLADVPVLMPDAEVLAALNERIATAEFLPWVDAPGPRGAPLPLPRRPAEPVHINRFSWPSGAGRFAVAYLLFDAASALAVRAASVDSGSITKPTGSTGSTGSGSTGSGSTGSGSSGSGSSGSTSTGSTSSGSTNAAADGNTPPADDKATKPKPTDPVVTPQAVLKPVSLFASSPRPAEDDRRDAQNSSGRVARVDVGTAVSTLVYVVRWLPIARMDASDSKVLRNCYLAMVVDERFFWQEVGAPDFKIGTTKVAVSWDDCLKALAGALKVKIKWDPVPPVYLVPDVSLNQPGQSAAEVLDIVSWNVGCRVVRQFDGSVSLMNAEASYANRKADFASEVGLARPVLGGGLGLFE